MSVFRYWQPNDRRTYEGWFVAFVDEETGCLAVLSDYGDYSYRWPAAGMPEGLGLRRFLTECDPGYILRKLSPRQVYDGEATLNAIHEDVCQTRRRGVLERDEAREEWDEALEVAHHECCFGNWLNGTRLSDASELYRTQVDPQARAFMERVWPRLVAEIEAQAVTLSEGGRTQAREPGPPPADGSLSAPAK